jgi:alkanesulfonate monooxygenase SsuD/methylene tetrahydromethanopterin reductase-like flavin-dependent oxidoreductase (luciferase family)
MLTWIAARTSRIKVASRVLAVPFRRPAMVAKLAVSLDLLSGGRFILGLGAGYSNQEIAAVGGPALSPAEKIDGLAEAIQVIRGAWARSGYTQHGRRHSVRDLTMEPKPTHPIPVWLGTRLTGDRLDHLHRHAHADHPHLRASVEEHERRTSHPYGRIPLGKFERAGYQV